jgi:two-component system, NarL family, nitrate/nitrite response regulator NarL
MSVAARSDTNETHTADSPARLLLADAHPLMIEGISARIAAEADLAVIDHVSELEALLPRVERSEPDAAVVAFDLWPPPTHHVRPELMRALAAHTRLIVIYDEIVPHEAWSALHAGAKSLISRVAEPDTLIDAIRETLRGGAHLDAPVQRDLTELIQRQGANGNVAITGRERTILRLSAEGLTTDEIARHLQLSVSSIKAAFRQIYVKLDVRDRPAAVAHALRRGLIT